MQGLGGRKGGKGHGGVGGGGGGGWKGPAGVDASDGGHACCGGWCGGCGEEPRDNWVSNTLMVNTDSHMPAHGRPRVPYIHHGSHGTPMLHLPDQGDEVGIHTGGV